MDNQIFERISLYSPSYRNTYNLMHIGPGTEAAKHRLGSLNHVDEVRVEAKLADLLFGTTRSFLQILLEALSVAPLVCIHPEPFSFLDQPIKGVVVCS